MNKGNKVQMQVMYCLCNLLLESLDRLKPTSELMILFRGNLIGMCEEINNASADTDIVYKDTHFQEMSNKINTLIRKNYTE